MSPIYDQISANRRRTVILIAGFVAALGILGWTYGQYSGIGDGATVLALALAGAMTLVTWFAGDKLALATAGAKGPIAKADAPELYRLVENLSIASGLPTPKVYVVQDDAINAFATGRDPAHASIAVTAGALARLDRTELEGVLGHELSHVKNYDVRYMLLVAVLAGALVMLASWMRRAMFWGGGRRRGDRQGEGGAIVLVVGIVLAILAPLFAEIIKLAVSRQREYLADASGALLTRYPEGLARALERIGAEAEPVAHANEATAHLWFANPFGDGRAVSRLFSTHPPLQDRIARLRAMSA